MRAVGLVLLLCAVSGCTARRPDSGDPVREYLRLAVALGERDPDSLDHYYGPDSWVQEVRVKPTQLPEIKRSALDLIERLKTAPPGSVPAEFLSAQLRAVAGRADLLMGKPATFDDEASELFGVQTPPVADEEKLGRIREEIARLLPGTGSAAARYDAFDQTFLVPFDKLPAVMERAMSECRARTTAHVTLPEGENVRMEYVSDKPWGAYSRYLGNYRSVVQVNTDFPVTVDRALNLACHEGYPGHHAFNALQDQLLVRGRGHKELMVQPTFSPQSFESESAAAIAPELTFPEDERLAFERDTLFPLAGLDPSSAERYLQVEHLIEQLELAEVPIARDYLDGKLEFLRAGKALEREALMAHPEATLKYINEFRTYMLSYTLGKTMARSRILSETSPEEAWRRYRQWIAADGLITDTYSSHL